MEIDLLTFVDQGGCSAKLSAVELNEALSGLPKIEHPNILVDIDTHDDGGVYKINDDYALIQTTDFFPPVCSDPYDFGQVAAANALSDVFAMGGQVLTAMNLVLFPEGQPMSVLKEILRGGQEKVVEAGGVILGGHTITDDIPKYGLAVTGNVHPDKIITNNRAMPGDVLILTKPIGSAVIVSAWKNKLISKEIYTTAIENMKQLNMQGAVVMQKYGVKCATDVTGFGVLGHALKMAESSGVTIHLYPEKVPVLPQVMELIDMGVIPGASFRNQEFAEEKCAFDPSVSYNYKMMLYDAQTSGGLLMCVPSEKVAAALEDLIKSGYPLSAVVGEVSEKETNPVHII